MQIVSYILCIVGAFFNLYVLVRCYAKVNDKDFKLSVFNLLVMMIAAALNFGINVFLISKYKILLLYLVIFLSLKFIFKENIYQLLYKSFIFYILLLFCDFIMSLFLMLLPIDSEKIYALNLTKALSTIFDSIAFLILFTFRKTYNFIKKSFNSLEEKYSIHLNLFIFLFLIMFLLVTYLNAYNFDFNTFFFVFIIITSFLVLSVILLKSYFKNSNALKEQQSLLNIMSEYEGMLEKDRINRHEMINNLLVLKSFDDKNSDKYKEILDDIIKEYQENKSKTYRSLYSLPNGVKGIVYYKMSNIIDQGIEFTSEISNMVYEEFDKLESKLYYKVCKIVGILIDNAIEAAVDTKEKFILIEMFKQKNTLNIIIENSFNNNVDLNDINKKGFSTKGKNRGYGLHIVNKLVKSSDDIFFKQSISNSKFLSELKITLH